MQAIHIIFVDKFDYIKRKSELRKKLFFFSFENFFLLECKVLKYSIFQYR